ncbi:MAG: hypothetical protein NT033_09755 [Candidatus Omnitrophica bacterium]|nr:hypothetical protein [Candidatus Omnitrophota bacterium]
MLELIIALCIFSVIFLGFASIQLFSREQFLTAKRRTIVQNDVALMLEHLTKTITGSNICGGAIGDKNNFPIKTLVVGGQTQVKIRVDTYPIDSPNGKLDNPGDGEVTYVYKPSEYRIYFYSDINDPLTAEYVTGPRILGDLSNDTDKSSYIFYDQSRNYVEAQIVGLWDPTKPVALDNPRVVMRTRIKMPSVSY